MAKSRSARNSTASENPVLHIAARTEDRFHAFRERRARKSGRVVTVVPYRGYGNTEWVRVLCRVLLTKSPKPGSKAAKKYQKRSESVRGWRSFVSVPVPEAEVTITINGYTEKVKADRGGVVDVVLPLKLEAGEHPVKYSAEDSEVSEQFVNVVSKDITLGVISDVDDTVMVTALPRPFVAAWNSFVLDEHARVPTPGMAVFLRTLSQQQATVPVIYLSTGAWNVAPTLRRFLSRNLYPPGAMLLTDWGPTHDRAFRSGREHKERQLDRLGKEFPNIKWILVGDDGQHDEAIYTDFEAKFPDNVAAVAIRQLSTSEAVLAGGRKKGLAKSLHGGAPWVYGGDGASLLEQLTSLGVVT